MSRSVLTKDVFFKAVSKGNLEKVKECIQNGISKEVKNKYGMVALHCASNQGHVEIVKYLIETCQVNTEAKDNTGWTALHCASGNGRLAIVKYLIEACHVDKEAKTNEGWTALHCASLNGFFETVKYLIETGHLDTKAKNSDGKTVYDFAMEYNHTSVTEYFEQSLPVVTIATATVNDDLIAQLNAKDVELAELQSANQSLKGEIEYLKKLLHYTSDGRLTYVGNEKTKKMKI